MTRADITNRRFAVDHARHAMHVVDMPLEGFTNNRLVRQCVAFDLVAISEFVWMVPTETQALLPGVEWADIRATRNRIVHGPGRIKWATLFEIVRRDLPALVEHLESLAKLSDGKNP